MRYVPVYKRGEIVAVATVDDDRFAELYSYRWLYEDGYAVRRARKSDGGSLTAKQSMHRQAVRVVPGQRAVVHHRNGDRLDNRVQNLRIFSCDSVHHRVARHLGEVAA